ncbi:AGE family epimerase/isomerase [Labrys sp. KNU-23]|uniref:AGE family epimerase/isomerase n=1 Tax=Labrys sp. KNU-23 TaxID=2789216 RepID=UPI0011ECBCE8|nr:AGE family epimerase/isomerase [Labrys sp. KNU-23]QEN86090.1 AGE family epimerase/isomerase [Labrys sp. KNU-23]
MTDFPDFRSRTFLLDHIDKAMGFYHPVALDPSGGFYNVFSNDGAVLDARTRSLVSSCRFLFIHANAYRLFGRTENRDAARHGLQFLLEQHRIPQTLGYRWQFDFEQGKRSKEDSRNITYGFSFVVLAFASALKAGLPEAAGWLDEVVEVMEHRIYEPEAGLYADEASADWAITRAYRGQNANMHACEAMLAAYEATGKTWYLDRADDIAHAISVRQASLAPLDQVWEHFKPDWSLDADYNFNDNADGYRPWGYLAGHQTEWSKLLLMLDRHRPTDWHVERARSLFDRTLAAVWDEEHGGMLYSYGHDGRIYDDSKQQWVHAETIAAAAHLAAKTGDQCYWNWYDRLWRFIWQNFADHTHGGWYRALKADNTLATAERGIPEPDYHNMGACAEILTLIDDIRP